MASAKNRIFIKPKDALITPILFLIAGAMLLAIGARGATAFSAWLLIFYIPSHYLLAVLPHELGHLLAAKVVGLKQVALVIGNFWIRFVGPKPRVGFSDVFMAGGYVTVTPQQQLTKSAAVIFAMGAPLVNIGLLVAGVVLYVSSLVQIRVEASPTDPAVWGCAIGAAIALTNGLLLPHSIIPRVKHGFRTDAATARDALRSPSFLRVLNDLMFLNAQQYEGKRPREWNRKLLEKVLQNKDDFPDQIGILMYSYYMELDAGNKSTAEQVLSEALSLADSTNLASKEAAFLEAAVFYGFFLSDSELCEKYVGRSSLVDVIPDAALSTGAALAFAKADYGKAAGLAEKYLRNTGPDLSPGLTAFHCDIMEDIRRRAIAMHQAAAELPMTQEFQ